MSWYAIWVLSRAESTVADALEGREIKTFVPTYQEVVQWSDRKKIVTRPLFPGYIFAELPRTRIADVLQIAGVVDVLPNAMNPKPVDAEDIANVRRVLEARVPAEPCQFVQGDEIRIDTGPLAGVKGVVLRTKNGTRLVVKIEMLKRYISVEMDATDAQKVAA